MAKRNHALVAVNASGFADETGRVEEIWQLA